ncbi:MAG: hypothetical protein CMI71_01295 [Candidatus Pelagibacter sp.]|nr:hypothetical protein [Candidatus Pelagibacter sp.]|tara:strand:- start:6755 stop:7510 length:756 start_codon:yes stop_codon:yes gene_type:complete
MKILIVCAGDRSKYNISLNIIKYLNKINQDKLKVCVLDNNKKIINFLKKKKISYLIKDKRFFSSIKLDEYEWLLNIWGHIIFKNEFLKKFKNNLNLHPSYLPYNKGRDPYYFSVLNQTPIGVAIHEMDKKVDNGNYYIRKKINFKFPFKAGEVFDISLKTIKDLFIKNWIKIRNGKIKLKKFSVRIKKTNKRIELIKNNFLNLDDKKNIHTKNFLLNCLAQDFDFLKQQIKIYNKIYDCKLILKRAKKKKW